MAAPQKKSRILSGTELRNRSWGMISRAHLDYAPKYIGLTENFSHIFRAIDGLIRTPMGYYRLAENTRDGTRILLHSYERDQLTGIERDGKIVLAESATDIYGVSARNDIRGTIFRKDMHDDIQYLELCLQKDLNLHAQETIRLTANPSMPEQRIVTLANGHAAFGIYETEQGRWKVRVHSNLRKSWDRAASFVLAGSDVNKNFTSRLFTLSRDLQEFDSYEDAFQYVRRFWKNESALLFKGKTALADPSKYTGFERIKARLLSTALHFFENKTYRDWSVAVSLGVGFGFLSTVAGGAPVWGALLGLGAGAAWAFAEKGAEAALFLYLSKKMQPDTIPRLRLLSQQEASINYDDGQTAPPVNPLKDFERLSSAPYRYFGAQFDATHAGKNTLACIFPNGLLSLVHIDGATTRHYVTYSERFNAFARNADKKHLDPKLTHLPGEGPIHKITHIQGKDFRYASMTGREFLADLMDKAGPEVKNFRVFGFTLDDIFNVEAAEDIAPAAKEAAPVAQMIGQQQIAWMI